MLRIESYSNDYQLIFYLRTITYIGLSKHNIPTFVNAVVVGGPHTKLKNDPII